MVQFILILLLIKTILTNLEVKDESITNHSHGVSKEIGNIVDGGERPSESDLNIRNTNNIVLTDIEIFPNSNLHLSYIRNYEYLISTSAKNNKIVCVEKEYGDLIYYTHDHKCDPQNTFSFSFNSTFKFDNDFYKSYEKSKQYFKEVQMTADLAVGSCISCFFLDEMNLLSIYGYTFVYKHSDEIGLKNEYEKIIDMNINNEKKKQALMLEGLFSREVVAVRENVLLENHEANKDNEKGDDANTETGTNMYGEDAQTEDDLNDSNNDTGDMKDPLKSEENNSFSQQKKSENEMNFNRNVNIGTDTQNDDNNNYEKKPNPLKQKDISMNIQNLGKHIFHSHEDNITLHHFLKENQISYKYDEIGKSIDDYIDNSNMKKTENTEETSDIKLMVKSKKALDSEINNKMKKSLNIKILDDFFTFLKKKEDQVNLKAVTPHKKFYALKRIDNLSVGTTECKYLKKHLKSTKIWSNVIFINSFRNSKILSHIHKYRGTYSDFKNSNVEYFYKKFKVNEFIKETLDLHNTDYLSYNHAFFIIANEEIKYVDELTLCPDVFNRDPKRAYIKNSHLVLNYEKLRSEYMSAKVYHQIFLTIALYINKKIHLFLLDEIKGKHQPLRLSVPFLYLITHSYFAQFNNIFLKDNMLGWVNRSKSLYAKSTKDILLIIEEASYFADKKFTVLTFENKLISNLYIMNLCHDTFEYVIFTRFNPLSDFSLHKHIGFEAVILYIASSFTKQELKNVEIFFEKLVNKDKTYLTKKKKIKRMNIYEIYVVPSDKYVNFHIALSYLLKAIFDCGGRHISKLLKIAILRSHYDMLYNLNCYNYRLYSLLKNIQDLSNNFFEYADLDDSFKESQKTLLNLVDLTLSEMENLIPFNKNKKYMIKYFIIILYYDNEVYCSDRENAIYLQIIYQYKEFNISHAIILSYLSQNKVGTLCLRSNSSEENKTVNVISDFNYTIHKDNNVYLKHDCAVSDPIDDNYSNCYLDKFNRKYFGDLHMSVKSDEILTIGLFIVSYTSTVNFFIGELDKIMNKINIYRLFKNVLVNNFSYNITKYFTFWNSKLYIFDQYEPECVLLFNKYHLYEKQYHENKTSSANIATEDDTANNSNDNIGDDKRNNNSTGSEKKDLNGNDRLYKNKKLMAYFENKRQTCVVHEKVGKLHSSNFVVNEYLQLRYNFVNRLKNRNDDLYKHMLSYNFFNDPLDISKKTSGYKKDKIVNICTDIEVHKNRLCLLHKSKPVLVYLYIMAALPELTYYVVSPLIFIKPYNYCDEYDIPLILNTMLKYKNFYKKNAKICINYAFAHFISSRNKTSSLNLTAKIRGTMVHVSKKNMLLIMPLIKRVNILYHSKQNEYSIKEEIVNEYFIWGNPHTPINVKPYEFFKYDAYKKSKNPTIAGAFITQFDGKYILYKEITRYYEPDKKCTKDHSYDIDGKQVCFCGILDHKFENKCTYPYCDEQKQFCGKHEECVKGKCECINGYTRNPISSLCELNNECILDGKNTCEHPASCVLVNKNYVCLCPYPYIRILKTCLHPEKGLKLGLRIFNNFNDNYLHDEESAFKKENFYIKVFGSLSAYITAAINWIIETDLKYRIYVKPVKKMKNGLKVTIVISRNSDPNEPTAVEILRVFLHQLVDANSALNDGFFSYFARYTHVDYVITFPENDAFFLVFNKFGNIVPQSLMQLFRMSVFSQMTFWASVSFILLIITSLMMMTLLVRILIKVTLSRKDRVNTF